jgi:hypothetical protein
MGFRLFAIFIAILAMTNTAHAYIDPGAGSFVLQMMLAGALAVGATVKVFWYRIKEGMRRILPGRQRVQDDPK